MIRKDNITELNQLIGQVSSMIEWVSSNTQSSKRLSMMKQLVGCRRRMKKIYNAMNDNPTIAAYGESQQGKSYIISSLLSSRNRPLQIIDDAGKKIDFIDNVNMRTDKQESTGVVTRFTTSKVYINPKYPVKLHLLSVADFITILSNSYMIDITGYQPYSEKDLAGIIDKIVEEYSDRPIVQDILTEDEVADIEEYIKEHNGIPGAVYHNSGYFDILGTIIRRVPEAQWVNVFSPLWKNDEIFNKFFSLFVSAYSKMKYAKDVYISIKAVLNDWNDGSPTLMCVRALDGLKELIEQGLHVGTQTEVLLPSNGSVYINKSLLSAMTAEAVYHIDEDILNDEVSFEFKGIRESEGRTAHENIAMLKELDIDKPFKKDFLKNVDLLDFPGARGRDLGFQPSEILKQIVNLLLRCKVSYLFTKYSEDLKLSILMFCHAQGNTTPNLVAPILNSWVRTYIGKDANERKERLATYNVPPLFLVSTMYNLDLMIKPGNVDTQIWKRRLNDIWYKEVINHATNLWFDEWLPNKRFDNTFMLRDYLYSSDAFDNCNNLFKGYPGPETEENQIEKRAELKKVFLNDPSVKIFFENPEVTWNVASTIGNDGSFYMLKRLADASTKASDARDVQFNTELKEITDNILSLIHTEFHDENDTELLEQSIRSARKFHFMLLRACEKQPDFFGRMVQYLQINSNFVTSYFAKLIRSNAIVEPTDVLDYEMLVRGVEEQGFQFDPTPSEAAYKANFQILEEVYGIMGPNDPMLNGIDPAALFQSTYKKNCTPSSILSNSLITYWRDTLLKSESSLIFTQAGFDGIVYANFVTNFTNMMSKVNLAQRIADAIKEYVDYTPVIAPQNEEMIADIATNIYNSFVMNLGYDYLSEEQQAKTAILCEKHRLPKIVSENEMSFPMLTDEEQISMLFSQLEALNGGEGGQLTQLPAYVNMRRWLSYVFMSFTIAYDVASYDEEANRVLGEIINDFSETQQVL